MIDNLSLPVDQSLERKPKKLPEDIFYEWVINNVRELHVTGRLETIRNSPQRRPTGVPFKL